MVRDVIGRRFEKAGQSLCELAVGQAMEDDDFGIERLQIERDLAQALIAGLQKIDGVKLWTHPSPQRSLAVVSFQPGSLPVPKLAAALYDKDKIGCATRGGADRGGLRFSPHLYNSPAEIDRVLAALTRYMRSGV